MFQSLDISRICHKKQEHVRQSGGRQHSQISTEQLWENTFGSLPPTTYLTGFHFNLFFFTLSLSHSLSVFSTPQGERSKWNLKWGENSTREISKWSDIVFYDYLDGDWLLQNIHLTLFEKDLFVVVALRKRHNLEFKVDLIISNQCPLKLASPAVQFPLKIKRLSRE